MKEDQIEEIKKTLIEALRKHGVKKAALFGSEKDCSTRNSPLLISVRRGGVESLIKRAMKYLKSAKILLENGDCKSSVSRAYYAMFYS